LLEVNVGFASIMMVANIEFAVDAALTESADFLQGFDHGKLELANIMWTSSLAIRRESWRR
jgi:hypothetical protein